MAECTIKGNVKQRCFYADFLVLKFVKLTATIQFSRFHRPPRSTKDQPAFCSLQRNTRQIGKVETHPIIVDIPGLFVGVHSFENMILAKISIGPCEKYKSNKQCQEQKKVLPSLRGRYEGSSKTLQ
mmetsp:Transcript_14696/g.40066  ORF Transcript_14696/g.40066 Transcript_14696/m.40066 type:complete len:126 (-) Transcript_14696:251-628(-)